VAGNQLVYAWAAQARWPEALAAVQQLITHRRQYLPGDRTGLALALQSLGSVQVAMGRYEEGEATVRLAIAESQAGGSIDAQVAGSLDQIRASLSALLLARGKAADALVEARISLATTQGGTRLNALHQMAQAQIALGELAGALATWREALVIVQQEPPLGEAWVRLRLMLAYVQANLTLGDRTEAQRWMDRADAEVARAPATLNERGQRWLTLALLREQQGRRAEALQALDEADAFYAPQFATDHPQRRDIAIRACGLGRGCDELAARLGVVQRQPRVAAAAALVLARHHLGRGEATAAAEQASVALQAAQAAAQPLLQWQALAEYARSQRAMQRPGAAIFFGKLALSELQRTRSRLAGLGPEADALYLADKAQVYREVAGWLFDAGRLPEGLQVLTLLKRSELDDFQERAAPQPPVAGLNREASAAQNAEFHEPTAEPSLTQREALWRRQLDAAAGVGREQAAEIVRLSRLQTLRRITTEETARLQALLAEQEAQSPAARARLADAMAHVQAAAEASRQPGARAAGMPGSEALDARQLRLPLPADSRTLHAYVLAGPEQLRVVLLGRQGQRVLHQPVGSAALGRQVAALLDAVRQRQDVLPMAQALYRQIGPLLDAPARAWGARRIVLWLDGPLRYLPMGLLHDGRQFLAARYALSVATPLGNSAGVGGGFGKGVGTAPALRIHAWGVTQALAGLPALPGVGDELCGIVSGPLRGLDLGPCTGALPGQGDLNAYFTEAAWRAAGTSAASGGVVHVGTHFVLRPGNVTQSWLLLGDGARLPLERLRRWPLGAPRLVTLSACETAVPAGNDADGREVDGLTATLLGSGAAQVLASLWRVDDRATAALMQRFYAEMKQRPGDVAAALQAAQMQALRAGQPAHVWAAFTVSAPAAR
jgi:CHAT domain-containing protein